MRVTGLIPGWNRDYSMRKNYGRRSSVTYAWTSLTHRSLGLLRWALPHLLLPAYPGFHHLYISVSSVIRITDERRE